MTSRTDLIPHLSVAEFARRYDELDIPGAHPADQSRVIVSTLKAIAKGTPVTASAVGTIAANAGMEPGAAAELLAGITERNADGDIIGLMGLSQNLGFDIKFTVAGQELRTWCALDSLFLPLLLDQEALVKPNRHSTETPSASPWARTASASPTPTACSCP